MGRTVGGPTHSGLPFVVFRRDTRPGVLKEVGVKVSKSLFVSIQTQLSTREALTK